jgi:hypothetical protein
LDCCRYSSSCIAQWSAATPLDWWSRPWRYNGSGTLFCHKCRERSIQKHEFRLAEDRLILLCLDRWRSSRQNSHFVSCWFSSTDRL